MKPDRKDARELEIEAAAYALLAEKGYRGMSMLAVARKARASNETMYRWYTDKVGLVRSMIARNAQEAKALLEAGIEADQDPLKTLAELGPVLLTLLTSEKAIALNRAAAADPSGELGQALAQEGRGVVGPLIMAVLARAHASERLSRPPQVALPLYMGLLVGDLQIRRAIGALPEPSKGEISARAAAAFADFCSICETGGPDG